MTHGSDPPRVIGVEGLSRVEGEGSLRVEVHDGTVTDVALEIFEPPRYFEALLVGRHFTEAPDITARICGICPVAYQMSACAAMEDACGVTVDEQINRLRRLLYCGEWIQSHALHIYLLHAPDFLGCADAVELAQRRPGCGGTGSADQADGQPGHGDRGWPGRAPGQRPGGRLLPGAGPGVGGGPDRATSSGTRRRAGHGRVGGGLRLPRRLRRLPLRGAARRRPLRHRARAAGVLRRPRREPGRVRRPRRRGARRPVHRPPRPPRGDTTRTSRAPWPAMPSMPGSSPPWPPRRRCEPGLGPVCTNPFRSIVVRAVELVFACEEALSLVESYTPPDPPAVTVTPRAGVGHRCHRGTSGPALPPVRDRRLGHDPVGSHRAAHLSEPAHHRSGPASSGPGRARAGRRRAAVALRAVGAQPRSLHLVRRSLPRRHGGAVVSDERAERRGPRTRRGPNGPPRRRGGRGERVPARRRGRARPWPLAAADEAPVTHDIGPVVDPLDLLGTLGRRRSGHRDRRHAFGRSTGDGAGGRPDRDGDSSSPDATSTHGISLSGVLRLAQAIDQAPARVVVVGHRGR